MKLRKPVPENTLPAYIDYAAVEEGYRAYAEWKRDFMENPPKQILMPIWRSEEFSSDQELSQFIDDHYSPCVPLC